MGSVVPRVPPGGIGLPVVDACVRAGIRVYRNIIGQVAGENCDCYLRAGSHVDDVVPASNLITSPEQGVRGVCLAVHGIGINGEFLFHEYDRAVAVSGGPR